MSEEIDRWIEYMRKNPKTWKKVHTEFINAQFERAYAFMERLLEEPDGKERMIAAYGIKNIAGYKNLLKLKK